MMKDWIYALHIVALRCYSRILRPMDDESVTEESQSVAMTAYANDDADGQWLLWK